MSINLTESRDRQRWRASGKQLSGGTKTRADYYFSRGRSSPGPPLLRSVYRGENDPSFLQGRAKFSPSCYSYSYFPPPFPPFVVEKLYIRASDPVSSSFDASNPTIIFTSAPRIRLTKIFLVYFLVGWKHRSYGLPSRNRRKLSLSSISLFQAHFSPILSLPRILEIPPSLLAASSLFSKFYRYPFWKIYVAVYLSRDY